MATFKRKIIFIEVCLGCIVHLKRSIFLTLDHLKDFLPVATEMFKLKLNYIISLLSSCLSREDLFAFARRFFLLWLDLK